jgi:hypothetical protein
MSKFSNRDAIKNLSALQVDAQFAYQAGVKVFNSSDLSIKDYKELCDNFRKVCDDILKEVEFLKNLIPND